MKPPTPTTAERKDTILMGKYEVGRLLGQGAFAKVYHGRHLISGDSVAIKVISKEKILKSGLTDQIKREISVMRLVRHPNVVRLHEVLASRTKIYFAMEYARGGELFARVSKGRLRGSAALSYFRQLINAVDFCHSRGVYHRDLKPENLLLDEDGNLKVSDFGLSALYASRRRDGLLHTMCGTPAYAAPEVIGGKGYDGAKADIWSCGVVLFVLLAGFLPFNHPNLMELYKRVRRAEFKCPGWFDQDVRRLLSRMLDPCPETRTTMARVMDSRWLKTGCVKSETDESPEDVETAFETQETEQKPTKFNAFDIISLSAGFNLSGLFQGGVDRIPERRFTTIKPAAEIMSKFEEIAEIEKFKVRKEDGRMRLKGEKEGRKGKLGITAEIFEVTPAFHVVEMCKTSGDTLEYNKFCSRELRPSLEDIVWTWQGDEKKP